MNDDSYSKKGLWDIPKAVVVARVNEGDPNPGLFHGLLDIFMLQLVESSTDPIRVRIHSSRSELVEKVNSLVGKPVHVVVNRSPWIAAGRSGIIYYLQSIEETRKS